jgi:DNA polymerase-3 subunit delta
LAVPPTNAHRMQITPAQIDQHLQRGLKSLYALHGDEPLLMQEAADAIRAAARAQGFAERSVHVVQGARFDWSEVLVAAGSLSLFAERRIVELRIPSAKPGKDGGAALEQVARQAQEDDSTLFLILLGKLDRQTRDSAWFGALSAQGVTIQIEQLPRHALGAWISQRLARQRQRLVDGDEGQRSLEFFADRVEGNLLACAQEIEKLALLYPVEALQPGQPPSPRILSFEQVESAVLNVARYDVFKLSETLLAGELGRARRMLEGLQAEGEAPVLVHYTISEDIRALKRARDALDQGRPLPLVLREQRVWGPRERLFERVLPQLSSEALGALLVSAHHVDGVVKGLRRPDWPVDAWQALHKLAGALCQACAAPIRGKIRA